MKLAIIFGGSGYIGSFLTQKLIADQVFDKIIIYDIMEMGKYIEHMDFEKLTYIKGDVRNSISIELPDTYESKNSWIFNFAAIHREPGHDYEEYFDTNIPGASNVCEFASKNKIRNMFFTSSIAPYGKTMMRTTEESPLYPQTAYGVSKALAERIHQQWLAEHPDNRLIIVRPSVIFGPKDPGNVYRMIKALKKGTFILPNGGNVIKAYGYVYGLIESMLFVIHRNEGLIIYNYAENPLVTLKEMTNITKNFLGFKRPTLSLSVKVLSILALILQIISKITGRKSDIHPVRVRKAGFPTNIKPNYLIENGFIFNYNFENALKHWKNIYPGDFE